MFEWLSDYKKQQNKIDYLDFKIEREKRELKRWVQGDLQDVRLTEGSIASELEERIFMMEYELAHLMNDLYNAKRLIDAFEGIDNELLKLRYIEGLKLEDVAAKMNYSESHIRKRHAELVRTVKFLEKYHSYSHIK